MKNLYLDTVTKLTTLQQICISIKSKIFYISNIFCRQKHSTVSSFSLLYDIVVKRLDPFSSVVSYGYITTFGAFYSNCLEDFLSFIRELSYIHIHGLISPQNSDK